MLLNRQWNGLPLVIFGNAGAANETLNLISDINKSNTKSFYFAGFVCRDGDSNESDFIAERDFKNFAKGFKILGVALPFGDTGLKKFIYNKIIYENKNIVFPNIIHPSAIISDTLKMGVGNIICANTVIDPDVEIGNFVFINIASTIGHNTIISDFTTINLAANISGSCIIEEAALIGTNCSIKQGVRIGMGATCGMGAIVVDNVDPGVVVVSPKAVVLNNT